MRARLSLPRVLLPHTYTCPSLSPSPPAHSFIIGPAVINTHTHRERVTVTGEREERRRRRRRKIYSYSMIL